MRTSKSPASSRGARPFTVAWVPTGMNTGVSTMPWGVCSKPARARVTGHSAWISKGNLLADNLFQPARTMIEFGELRQKLALILLGPDGAEFCLHQVFQLAAQFSKPGVHVRPARRRSGRLDSHFARYSRPRRRSGSTSDPLRWRRTVARSYAACLQSTRFCGSVGARHSIQSIGRAEAAPSHSLCASTLPHRGAAIAYIPQEVR